MSTHPSLANEIQNRPGNVLCIACPPSRDLVEQRAEDIPLCTDRIHVARNDYSSQYFKARIFSTIESRKCTHSLD